MAEIVDSLEKLNEMLQICGKNRVRSISIGNLSVTFDDAPHVFTKGLDEVELTDKDLALYWSTEG